MRTRIIFGLSLIFLCLIFALSFAEEKPLPLRLNQLLKEELSLAKTPALYFIFDLEGKSIMLKSRAMVLQEWKVESVHFWGVEPSLKDLTVVKKSALFAPKRKKIMPGAAEQQGEKFELEALELKDMPSTYVLYLSEGIYLYIRPNPQKFISRLGNIGHLFNWYLWVPLRNLGFELGKKPFTAIDVKLANKEDAQALYWALAEGTKGVVFYP
jgi:hypothetical protein